MRALSFLLLLTVTATGARRMRARDIQRLDRDDPVPAGWRLATYDDAKRNNACFNLVLKGWQTAELADGYKVSGWRYNNVVDKMVRACKGCPDPGLWSEQHAHKVVVSFGKGTVLGRERFEHNLRQVGDIALVVLGLTVSFDLIGQLNSFLASSLDRRGYGRLVALVVAGCRPVPAHLEDLQGSHLRDLTASHSAQLMDPDVSWLGLTKRERESRETTHTLDTHVTTRRATIWAEQEHTHEHTRATDAEID